MECVRPAWLEWVEHLRPNPGATVRQALHWVSAHTGLPIVLVAALGLVLSYRLAKRTAHLVIELAVALAVLLLATKLGWIRW